jgi:hypothetical protein
MWPGRYMHTVYDGFLFLLAADLGATTRVTLVIRWCLMDLTSDFGGVIDAMAYKQLRSN